MAATNQELFATADVAKLLKQPEWRVIKFVEGEQYGIKPAATIGSGIGSRRLYDLENLCEFVIALRLIDTGLRSLDIGRVLEELRQKETLSKRIQDNEDLYLAIAREPRSGTYLWRRRSQEASFVHGFPEAEEILKRHKNYALILVPVGSKFQGLKQRLSKLKRGEL